MVSVLVCMVAHQIELTMIYKVSLLGSHNFTKLLCGIISQP